MMKLINKLINIFGRKRLKRINFFKKNPRLAQENVFHELIKKGKETLFGIKYNLKNINSIEDFQKQVPISSYEDLLPYIKRMMQGEKSVLWPGMIKWFAKSAGTTSGRSKFIPVSKKTILKTHFQGGKDVLFFYLKRFPASNVLQGQHIAVAGSLEQIESNKKIKVGDISAITIKNIPFLLKFFIGPGIKTTLLKNWQEKAKKIAHMASKKNITAIAGVPSWISLLMKKFLEIEHGKNILEIWPRFELLVHGGVSIEPYKKTLNEILPKSKVNYLEVYNASEGFFALQDDLDRNDMLLMLDYGIFYEFLPMKEIGRQNPKAVTVEKVKKGINYAVVISTDGGLWRYLIGDTVEFTSIFPHRIKITGRTKHFINTFGEEVIVENAEKALAMACEKTDALATEFTAAPILFEASSQGAHEWAIEFEREPSDKNLFEKVLDESLRQVNSDYDAKRFKDMLLRLPIIHFMPKGTFYKWFKEKGKLGGQNKVPRLSNSREYIEEILAIAIINKKRP